MYLTINKSSRVVDISPYAHYVKRQKNGNVVKCLAEEADAIYSSKTDTFYPILSGYNDVYSLVEVAEILEGIEAGYCHYSGGEFVVTESDRIALLRKKLADTDYQAIKHSEGLLTDAEYEPVKLQRQAWRDEINMLEAVGNEEENVS